MDIDEMYQDIFRRPGASAFSPRKSESNRRRQSCSLSVEESSVDIYEDMSMDCFPSNSESSEVVIPPSETACHVPSPVKKPVEKTDRTVPDLTEKVKDTACHVPSEKKTVEKADRVDLDLFTEVLVSDSAHKAKDTMQKKLSELEQKSVKLEKENKGLQTAKEQLLKNFSSVVLTARTELQKKEDELRQKGDEIQRKGDELQKKDEELQKKEEELQKLRKLVTDYEEKNRSRQVVRASGSNDPKQAHGSAVARDGSDDSGSKRRDHSSKRPTSGVEADSRRSDKARVANSHRRDSSQGSSSRSKEAYDDIESVKRSEVAGPSASGHNNKRSSYSPVKFQEEKKEEPRSVPDSTRRGAGGQFDLRKKLSRRDPTTEVKAAVSDDSCDHSMRQSLKRVHLPPEDSPSEKVVKVTVKSHTATERSDAERASHDVKKSSVADVRKVDIGRSDSSAGCQAVVSRRKSKDSHSDLNESSSSSLIVKLNKGESSDSSKRPRRISFSKSPRDHKSVKSGECSREGQDQPKGGEIHAVSESHIRSSPHAEPSSVGKPKQGPHEDENVTDRSAAATDISVPCTKDKIGSPIKSAKDRLCATQTDGKQADKLLNDNKKKFNRQLFGHSSKDIASGEDRLNKEVISDKNTSIVPSTGEKHNNKNRPFKALRTSAASFFSSVSDEELNSPSSNTTFHFSNVSTPPKIAPVNQERGNSNSAGDTRPFDIKASEDTNSSRSLSGLHFKKGFLKNFSSKSDTNSNNGVALEVLEDVSEPIEIDLDVEVGNVTNNCNSLGTKGADELFTKPVVGPSSSSSTSSKATLSLESDSLSRGASIDNCSSSSTSKESLDNNKVTLRRPPSPVVTNIVCTSNLIMLGDEETSCTTFPSPHKPHLLPTEFYPPGQRAPLKEGVSHFRHIRGPSEIIQKVCGSSQSKVPETQSNAGEGKKHGDIAKLSGGPDQAKDKSVDKNSVEIERGEDQKERTRNNKAQNTKGKELCKDLSGTSELSAPPVHPFTGTDTSDETPKELTAEENDSKNIRSKTKAAENKKPSALSSRGSQKEGEVAGQKENPVDDGRLEVLHLSDTPDKGIPSTSEGEYSEETKAWMRVIEIQCQNVLQKTIQGLKKEMLQNAAGNRNKLKESLLNSEFREAVQRVESKLQQNSEFREAVQRVESKLQQNSEFREAVQRVESKLQQVCHDAKERKQSSILETNDSGDVPRSPSPGLQKKPPVQSERQLKDLPRAFVADRTLKNCKLILTETSGRKLVEDVPRPQRSKTVITKRSSRVKTGSKSCTVIQDSSLGSKNNSAFAGSKQQSRPVVGETSCKAGGRKEDFPGRLDRKGKVNHKVRTEKPSGEQPPCRASPDSFLVTSSSSHQLGRSRSATVSGCHLGSSPLSHQLEPDSTSGPLSSAHGPGNGHISDNQSSTRPKMDRPGQEVRKIQHDGEAHNHGSSRSKREISGRSIFKPEFAAVAQSKKSMVLSESDSSNEGEEIVTENRKEKLVSAKLSSAQTETRTLSRRSDASASSESKEDDNPTEPSTPKKTKVLRSRSERSLGRKSSSNEFLNKELCLRKNKSDNKLDRKKERILMLDEEARDLYGLSADEVPDASELELSIREQVGEVRALPAFALDEVSLMEGSLSEFDNDVKSPKKRLDAVSKISSDQRAKANYVKAKAKILPARARAPSTSPVYSSYDSSAPASDDNMRDASDVQSEEKGDVLLQESSIVGSNQVREVRDISTEQEVFDRETYSDNELETGQKEDRETKSEIFVKGNASENRQDEIIESGTLQATEQLCARLLTLQDLIRLQLVKVPSAGSEVSSDRSGESSGDENNGTDTEPAGNLFEHQSKQDGGAISDLDTSKLVRGGAGEFMSPMIHVDTSDAGVTPTHGQGHNSQLSDTDREGETWLSKQQFCERRCSTGDSEVEIKSAKRLGSVTKPQHEDKLSQGSSHAVGNNSLAPENQSDTEEGEISDDDNDVSPGLTKKSPQKRDGLKSKNQKQMREGRAERDIGKTQSPRRNPGKMGGFPRIPKLKTSDPKETPERRREMPSEKYRCRPEPKQRDTQSPHSAHSVYSRRPRSPQNGPKDLNEKLLQVRGRPVENDRKRRRSSPVDTSRPGEADFCGSYREWREKKGRQTVATIDRHKDGSDPKRRREEDTSYRKRIRSDDDDDAEKRRWRGREDQSRDRRAPQPRDAAVRRDNSFSRQERPSRRSRERDPTSADERRKPRERDGRDTRAKSSSSK